MVSLAVSCELTGCTFKRDASFCYPVCITTNDCPKVGMLVEVLLQTVKSEDYIAELSISVRHHQRNQDTAKVGDFRFQAMRVSQSVKRHFDAIQSQPE